MERLIRIDQQLLDKPGIDRFALQTTLTGVMSGREYLMGGQWSIEKPSSRPDGERIVFDSIDQFRAARDTYFAWLDINLLRQDAFRPVYPDAIMQRLLEARINADPVLLFVPWGVRPGGSFGQSEISVLERIKKFQDGLTRRNIPSQVLIMPADLYATEVNNQVGDEQVVDYFGKVATAARESFRFAVKPWSTIRTENWQTYQARAQELTPSTIRALLTPYKIQEAIAAAKRRSGYEAAEDIRSAAFRYLRERVCEAEIVETKYKPIKVSAVPKNKDAEVDRDLPRLYIIPSNQQFPWLK